MSYSVVLAQPAARQIAEWKLPSLLQAEILKGLDQLALNPNRLLIRVVPPEDTLQYDLAVREPGNPPQDHLFTFTVVYASDEETLLVTNCDHMVIARPDLSTEEPRSVMGTSTEESRLAPIVAEDFIRYFRHLAGRVDRHVRSIPREALWVKPFPFGNSVGHLVLHLTGNLNHYIGAVIARTGYVRDREHEFIDPTQYPAEEVLGRFHEAVDLVERTIRSLDAEALMVPVHENPPVETRFGLLLVCLAHLNNHIGQMSYLVQAQGHSTQEPPIW